MAIPRVCKLVFQLVDIMGERSGATCGSVMREIAPERVAKFSSLVQD
jgi:hypothetical protein